MVRLTEKEWEERAERIKQLESERLANGWTKDQYGRMIPPVKQA